MPVSTRMNLYSPRWGHGDEYSVEFDDKGITITQGIRSAHWDAHHTHGNGWTKGFDRQPLLDNMENDSIYAPRSLPGCFEALWNEWSAGSLSDADVVRLVGELGTWINEVTNCKPPDEFWSRVF